MPRRMLEVTFPAERVAEQVWQGELAPERIPGNLRASIERLRRELRPERGPVRWSAVRERRRAALARLAVVERYAAGPRCRRAALLEYFGERLSRCAGCDVCSGRQPRHALSPVDRAAARRLSRLRLALGTRHSPWGGCLLEPRLLRRLAEWPPDTEAALAAVEGVGPLLARRLGGTILGALNELEG